MTKDEAMGRIPRLSHAIDLLLLRIEQIKHAINTEHKPILFFTGETNFRNEIAKRKQYKKRSSIKPLFWKELRDYMKKNYEFREIEGLEGDDLMAIEQTKRKHETVICSRDKDLRQVEGWQFSWELGNQPQFGPHYVEGIGSLWRSKTLRGTGIKFFYAQLLAGDSVDNVPGVKGIGPAKAFDILDALETEDELYDAVFAAYKETYGNRAMEELQEQANLLWLIRELDERGQPVMWQPPQHEPCRETS